MHNEFKKELVNFFKKSPLFEKENNNEFVFKIKTKNIATENFETFNVVIELFFEDDIPIFRIKNYRNSILLNCGHVYGDGVICHNIPSIKAIKENAKWYGQSIIQFLNSLRPILLNKKIFSLKSNLNENDLVEYEKMSNGSFHIIADSKLENIKEGDLFILRKSTINDLTLFVRYDQFNVFPNPYIWKVEYVQGDKVKLFTHDKVNGEKIEVEALFQPTQMPRKTLSSETKINNVTIIGVGSLGSYFLQNYFRDYLNGKLFIIDPDYYLEGNKKRHLAGHIGTIGLKKAEVLKKICDFQMPLKNKEVSTEIIDQPIGLRTHTIHNTRINNALNSSNIIFDFTGGNVVLEYLFNNIKNKNTIIFKAALYNSGNAMICSNVDLKEDFHLFIDKWDKIRTNNKFEVNSAYTSVSPANNSRISLQASLLNELVSNKTLKKGDIKTYDWNSIIREIEKANKKNTK